MRIFTTFTKSKNSGNEKIRLWVILVWLFVWEIAARSIGSEILLVSPVKVLQVLWKMLFTAELYKTVSFSLVRIVGGFLAAVLCGVILGALSFKVKFVRELIQLPVSVIKATPVASFIILVLIWIPSKNLSVFISFLMAFPIIYTNVCEGLISTDKKLLEMADVFEVSNAKKIRYIYIPQIIPFFRPSCALALGYCFKSGIAAEIIGLSRGSIGERIYQAKIYLETPELFAWTVVVIAVSIAFTKLFLLLIDFMLKKLEGR